MEVRKVSASTRLIDLLESIDSRLARLEELAESEAAVLDREAAARHLCIGQSTFDREVREGQIAAVRVGQRVLFRREELERFLREREQRGQRGSLDAGRIADRVMGE